MCYTTLLMRRGSPQPPQQLELELAPAEQPEKPRRRQSSRSRKQARSEAALGRRHDRHTAIHPSPAELLATPGALLTRSHLRDLGLERRAVDAVFRLLPVVALPGYSRPMIRADQYRELVERSTYCDDRVRPVGNQDAHG
jgi:hypothetical protein